MSVRKPHDSPTEATAEHGEVMLDGPEGLAVSMTPDAAQRSANSLARAAAEAAKQRDAADGEAAAEPDAARHDG